MSVLRYTSLSDALPRHELAPGRRLGSGGILSGALHTLGYVRRHPLYASPLCAKPALCTRASLLLVCLRPH